MKNISSRMTPIDKDYPSCDDVYVNFTVYVDFNDIKEFVDFVPTKIQKQGDVITNSLGKTRISKSDLWILSSDGNVSSKDARDHLDFILQKIYPNKNIILTLQENHKMYVSCVWFSNESIGGPVIWPEQMKLLSELNLELNFSFYPHNW